MGFGHFPCFINITPGKGNNSIWNSKPDDIQLHFRGYPLSSIICQNCETKGSAPLGSQHLPQPHVSHQTQRIPALHDVILTQKVKQIQRDFQVAEVRHQIAKMPAAALEVAVGGLGLSPRTSRGHKENSSLNVCLSQTQEIWMKVTKTTARCSTKAKTHPAFCLPCSLPTPWPRWKPWVGALQLPGEGSCVVPAASSSTRHPPCRLRSGNG